MSLADLRPPPAATGALPAPVQGLAGRLPATTPEAATAARIGLDPRFAACLAHWSGDGAARVAGVATVTPAAAFGQPRAHRLRARLVSLVGAVEVLLDPSDRAELLAIDRLLASAHPPSVALALDLANLLLAQAVAAHEAQALDLRVDALARVEASAPHPAHGPAANSAAALGPELRLSSLTTRLLGMDAEFGLFALEEMRSNRRPPPAPAGDDGGRHRGLPAALAGLSLCPVLEVLQRDLPASVLAGLGAGDVVLAGPQPLPARWRVGRGRGRRAAARLDLSAGVVTLVSSVEIHQDALPMTPNDACAATAVGDIELPVHFEIDGASITLDDLAHLVPGHVVALNLPLAQAAVQLRCQGQTIGRGQLIAVGDQVGVRIAQMTWSGHAVAQR